MTGAGGSLGVGRVARAPGDGYTLSLGQNGSHVINGATYALSYDLLNDFEPVALLTTTPLLVLARNALPAGDLASLIAWPANCEESSSLRVPVLPDAKPTTCRTLPDDRSVQSHHRSVVTCTHFRAVAVIERPVDVADGSSVAVWSLDQARPRYLRQLKEVLLAQLRIKAGGRQAGKNRKRIRYEVLA